MVEKQPNETVMTVSFKLCEQSQRECHLCCSNIFQHFPYRLNEIFIREKYKEETKNMFRLFDGRFGQFSTEKSGAPAYPIGGAGLPNASLPHVRRFTPQNGRSEKNGKDSSRKCS